MSTPNTNAKSAEDQKQEAYQSRARRASLSTVSHDDVGFAFAHNHYQSPKATRKPALEPLKEQTIARTDSGRGKSRSSSFSYPTGPGSDDHHLPRDALETDCRFKLLHGPIDHPTTPQPQPHHQRPHHHPGGHHHSHTLSHPPEIRLTDLDKTTAEPADRPAGMLATLLSMGGLISPSIKTSPLPVDAIDAPATPRQLSVPNAALSAPSASQAPELTPAGSPMSTASYASEARTPLSTSPLFKHLSLRDRDAGFPGFELWKSRLEAAEEGDGVADLKPTSPDELRHNRRSSWGYSLNNSVPDHFSLQSPPLASPAVDSSVGGGALGLFRSLSLTKSGPVKLPQVQTAAQPAPPVPIAEPETSPSERPGRPAARRKSVRKLSPMGERMIRSHQF
ncbi:uncharacterized protein L969DRAFT_85158 [Mixia osmundae IAM 14324]|uniref:Uncharacterized protein n=1 Tax=Mixia osmundae (strain CBS 9802 / IAM 14324 / JCM 22182 / KY 12970) TaxID=764103 RepID=G7DY23_MIXOS|nr:uncharacterized protein L969DRAFT_85158 [Mixia osmundae IAM 14324]KEI41384.1 hypothetical protein L969DRAFT_85158 [Mixia osmundae IAM 14324]GAA95483.1 hypothetical protein E5Q_02137 [Mixia osmundae IAM 14324]